MTSGAKTVAISTDLIENRYWSMEWAIECFFFVFCLAIIVFEITIVSIMIVIFLNKLTFAGLWWPQFWPLDLTKNVLTLLLLGGKANRPPGGFSDLYQKLLALAPWNLGTFLNHWLGVLYQNFDFLPCAEAAPGPFLRRYFSLNLEFSDIFHRSARCWCL